MTRSLCAQNIARMARGLVKSLTGTWAKVCVVALASLAIGTAIARAFSSEDDAAPLPAAPVRVFAAQKEISFSQDLTQQAREAAREWLRGRVRLWSPVGSRVVSRAELGAEVELTHLARLLTDASDPKSPMRRVHAQALGSKPLVLPMPFELDATRATQILLEMKNALDREAHDARVDTTQRTVAPERVGYSVDVWTTLHAIEEGLLRRDEAIPIVMRQVAPQKTRASIGRLDMRAVLGQFETRYNAARTAADRTFNLLVAAQRIDGLVLMPGEEFDFNHIVGERNEVNGFRPAPVISDGELVDGLGGGACQIAGTIHAAAFFAGLPITQRHPHTRPSYYIKLGLDAAVAYPTLNLRFRNDRDVPIVVSMQVSGGVARAVILGAQQPLATTFTRRITELFPYEERFDDDPSLPTGVRVLSQRGIPGFRISRWRAVHNTETQQDSMEEWKDLYPSTTQIWRVGSSGPAPEGYVPPASDDHPEYIADEYVAMTQGAGIEGTREDRRPGRTGEYGWTEAFVAHAAE